MGGDYDGGGSGRSLVVVSIAVAFVDGQKELQLFFLLLQNLNFIL